MYIYVCVYYIYIYISIYVYICVCMYLVFIYLHAFSGKAGSFFTYLELDRGVTQWAKYGDCGAWCMGYVEMVSGLVKSTQHPGE